MWIWFGRYAYSKWIKEITTQKDLKNRLDGEQGRDHSLEKAIKLPTE